MLEENERKELKRLIGSPEREEIEAYVEEIETETIYDAWSDMVLRSAIWLAQEGYRVTTYSLAVLVQMVVRNWGVILGDYREIADDTLKEMGEERNIPIYRPAANEVES